MITTIISDFSRVLLNPVDENYSGSLNDLHKMLVTEYGEDYPVLRYFKFNDELLAFYLSLKPGCVLSVFTSDAIQKHPDIQPRLSEVFEHVISAKDLGVKKSDSGAYAKLSAQFGFVPERTLYIDDQISNVEAARSAGFQGLVFSENQTLIAEVVGFLRK
ncbi:MAG: HAD-IA family hydrolase [Candidatus Doudnabacteria bacterium]|nr:HAD-IA family hydrolase [Candidatus Doudnabacteria bacterium]